MKFATFGRIAVTALLIAAPLGVASAADMAVKAPKAPPPPPFDWNGFYIGAYAGAAFMDQANTTDPCLATAARRLSRGRQRYLQRRANHGLRHEVELRRRLHGWRQLAANPIHAHRHRK
jgi:opacity protein-like surface antigen